jgi:hypothetical protein
LAEGIEKYLGSGMIGALARSMPRSCCVPVIELQTGRPREVIGIAGAGESDRDGLGRAEGASRDLNPTLSERDPSSRLRGAG